MTEKESKYYITTFHDYSKDAYVEGLNKGIVYRKAKLCPFIKPHRSLFLFKKYNRFRLFCIFVAESKLFEVIILLAILANCFVMALSEQLPNNDSTYLNDQLEQSEVYFIVIFATEAIIKIISYGFVLHKHSYLRNGWNVMDFSIVVIGLISFILTKIQSNSNIDVKSLRAFRVLRPLRLVSNVPSLQVVMNSILLALKPLGDVAILILFLIIVYAIVGMNLFMGKLHSTCYNNVTNDIMDSPSTCRLDVGSDTGYHCTGLNALPVGQQWVCIDMINVNASVPRWLGPNNGITNFDNIGLSMLTVFQIITQEGWTDDMYWVNDALGSEWPWVYFVSLVLLLTFFVLNLILGVLSGEFSKQSAKVSNRNKFLRDRKSKKDNDDYIGYKKWIEEGEKLVDSDNQSNQMFNSKDDLMENVTNYNGTMMNLNNTNTIKAKMIGNYRSFFNSKVRLQKSLRIIIKSRILFIIILVMVFLNAVIMATESINEPAWLSTFQVVGNYVFVVLFTIELVVKLFAVGFREYFSKLFNVYDFIVIFCSIGELILTSLNVLNPIGLAVFRCARLLRCFKLTKYWENLRTFVKNMVGSMKSIMSLLILLGLFIIIFALLGMQLFGGKFIFDPFPRYNFDTFYNSIFTVFQVLTGDDWNNIMYDGMLAYGGIQGTGGPFALFFLVLCIIGNYILLNVFVAIAVESLRGDEDDEEKDEDDQSTSNETDIQENIQNFDPGAKLPEIASQLVVVNGCAMLPPIVKSDIVSLSKIKQKSKRRINPEQRVRINFEIKEADEEIEEIEELNPKLGNPTYNDLYAEEVDDGNDDTEEPKPTIIPMPADFKRLKEKVVPLPTGSACFMFRDSNIFRIKCYNLVNHTLYKNMVLVFILLSSIMLACEDPVNDSSGRNFALGKFDYLFTGIFAIELIIKMIAYGVILHKNAFLRNAFNWIDLIVVLVGIIVNALPPDLNQGLSGVKTLRVLRVLRPLRAINRAKGLKHVLRCVLVALKSIGKIMIITFLLEFMFAVMGVIILKGTFNSCSDISKNNKNTCRGLYMSYPGMSSSPVTVGTRIWSNNPLNFDNVANAMLTMFTVATFSGWNLIFYASVDSTSEGVGPYFNNQNAIFIFYIVYLVLIAFFMINLFVGMVVVTFQKEGDAEFAKYKLDKNKRQCITFALKARPIVRYVPTSQSRYKVWRFVNNKKFENFIIVLILLNTICLMVVYMNQSQQYSDVLKYINLAFTIIFTIECLLKVYAYEFRNYFDDGMNIFDVIVVTGSYVDLAFSSIDVVENTFRINIFRLFRVFRLIRLLTKVKSIQKLFWTFFNSLKSLPYVALLIILTFFIYAVMGMQFFGKITLDISGSEITRNNNFQTFQSSILVLFRCVTGEKWQAIMISCSYTSTALCINSQTAICGTSISYFYFVSFIMLCCFLIMNLLVAVIVDNFDYLTRDKSILGCHHLDEFLTAWSQYDIEARGGIKHLDVINMLSNINPPLGFGKMCPQMRGFRNLIKLNMPLQTDGTVLFNATLFALVRRSLRINYSNKENEKKVKESNDELRIIIKKYWKSTNALLMDQIIPSNINESVTIGKFFATFVIENWYKKCRMAMFKGKSEQLPKSNSKSAKPKLTVKIANSNSCSDSVDNLQSESPLISGSSIEDAYNSFTDKVWSALTDIFTIPEENIS